MTTTVYTPESRLEDDPMRILRWIDTRSVEDVIIYYKQRLGPAFRTFPGKHDTLNKIEWTDFISLVRDVKGETDIISKMARDHREARSEFQIMFSHNSHKHVSLYLSLETPEPGQKAIEYIYKHKNCELHERFLNMLRELQIIYTDLHLDWKEKTKGGYYKINFPAPRGIAEREVIPMSVITTH